MATIRTISIIILFAVSSCKENNKNKSLSITQSDRDIDKVKLTDMKLEPIDLKQYNGKTVFINFWATWCKPCILEMPSIERAMENLKNQDIVFLFASSEAIDEIEEFKKAHEYNFQYVRADNLEALNIMALPTTYIFSPQGKLVFSEMGYRKWDDKSNIDIIINSKK